MALYKLIYKEKTFNYRGKLMKVTNEVHYEEDHFIRKAFKSHFVKVPKSELPQLLVEQPVQDAKVIVEDENVSTEIQGADATVISFDEAKGLDQTADVTVVVEEVDYNTFTKKSELVKYIEDKGLNVTIGNTKDVEKIKAKIKDALEQK